MTTIHTVLEIIQIQVDVGEPDERRCVNIDADEAQEGDGDKMTHYSTFSRFIKLINTLSKRHKTQSFTMLCKNYLRVCEHENLTAWVGLKLIHITVELGDVSFCNFVFVFVFPT